VWICFFAFWLLNMAVIWRGIETIKFLEGISAPFMMGIGLLLLWWIARKAGGLGPVLSSPSQLFDQFAEAHSPQIKTITRSLVIGFLEQNRHLSPTTQMHKLVTLRQFARFLFQLEPDTYIPERSLVPPRQPFFPHIYSLAETQALIKLAMELPPSGSLRPLTTATVIGLLWVSGLRLGEVCRLDMQDVDLDHEVVHIQRSKNSKSRLIPLKESTADALSEYREHRNRRGHDQAGSAAFFVNERASRLHLPGFEQTFRVLADQLGLKCPAGHRARLHDFRHSFATRCLAEGYDCEGDPVARLSVLTTYLGHSNVTETATYLHPQSVALEVAGERFRTHVQKRSLVFQRAACQK